jgi:hypothetical protein
MAPTTLDAPYGVERDIAPRADESLPATDTAKPAEKPCPEDTESLIDWLRESFPEISPRTSDPRVVDACIARSAIRDLIIHIEARLAQSRKDKEAAE